MCLAVPMRIVEMKEGGAGICELESIRYDVDLTLIENPLVDEYVIVHAGFAIEKLDVQEADARLQLFCELAEMHEKQVRKL
jgi:hydrogenase expression/formation protein HypC